MHTISSVPSAESHPTGPSTLEALTTTLSFIRSDKPVFNTAAFRPCYPTQAVGGGGAHMGDSQIAGVWTQGGNIGPLSLGYCITGPSCFDCYRQYHCCSLHQQTRWDPFPPPVAAGSGSVSVATDSGHNSKSQTHSGLP